MLTQLEADAHIHTQSHTIKQGRIVHRIERYGKFKAKKVKKNKIKIKNKRSLRKFLQI